MEAAAAVVLKTQRNLPEPYVHIQTGPLMRLGFTLFRPLHLASLFISLRAHTHTFFSFFVLCPFCLHVLSSHSLFCAHIRPALSLHVHSCTKPRSEVSHVVIMRYGSSGCSCSLGSFSSQPHTLSCLVFLSCLHTFVLCAHTCTLVWPLA